MLGNAKVAALIVALSLAMTTLEIVVLMLKVIREDILIRAIVVSALICGLSAVLLVLSLPKQTAGSNEATHAIVGKFVSKVIRLLFLTRFWIHNLYKDTCQLT